MAQRRAAHTPGGAARERRVVGPIGKVRGKSALRFEGQALLGEVIQ